MDYIIFPTKDLDAVPVEKLEELHLVPRKSIDGKEVVMKTSHYAELFPRNYETKVIGIDNDGNPVEEVQYPYDTYSSKQIGEILATDKWSEPIE